MARDWPTRPRVPEAAARVDRWAAFLPDPPIVSPGCLPATDTTPSFGSTTGGDAEISLLGRDSRASSRPTRRGRRHLPAPWPSPFGNMGSAKGGAAGALHRRSSFIGRDPEKERSESSTPRESRPPCIEVEGPPALCPALPPPSPIANCPKGITGGGGPGDGAGGGRGHVVHRGAAVSSARVALCAAQPPCSTYGPPRCYPPGGLPAPMPISVRGKIGGEDRRWTPGGAAHRR